MAPRKTTTAEPVLGGEAFRRIDDVERLAKLEYVVYEDHDPLLVVHSRDIRLITDTQVKMSNHLKNIRNILLAFLLGAAGTQVGWEQVLKLIGVVLV